MEELPQTGGFASPSRDGFALVGVRSLDQKTVKSQANIIR